MQPNPVPVETAMRLALIEAATVYEAKHFDEVKRKLHPVSESIFKAVTRGVGLTKRRKLWCVIRRKRQ